MRPISPRVKKILTALQEMKVCIHNDEDCQDETGRRPARAEWEHAFIYAGRQIDEWWAIIGVCWFHHRGPGLKKEYNRYRALLRMTKKDIEEAQRKYPRVDWAGERQRLIKKFTTHL